jgi:hypothetical protein
LIDRHAAFNTRHHQVLDPDVGERATDHHLVVAASRAVAVEVFDVNASILQVQTRRRRGLDCSSRTDVVRRN